MSASPRYALRCRWGTPQSSRMRGEADVGLGVDDDDRRAAQVELLDNAESDALQAAHDDVIA